MHPLNLFFDKIFVISIPRNKERLVSFLKNNPDIEVEIFNGIDGRELFPHISHVAQFPIDFFEDSNISYEWAKIRNKGQLGCALSHFLLRKQIFELKIKKTLIFEDDTISVLYKINYLENALRELPHDWELFYLGYTNMSRWVSNPITRGLIKLKYNLKPVSVHGKISGNPAKMFFPKSFSKHLDLAGMYTGTHAYALSLQGAEKIVNFNSPLQYGSDTGLMHACYHKIVNGFALKKQIFIPQPGVQSSLQESVVYN